MGSGNYSRAVYASIADTRHFDDSVSINSIFTNETACVTNTATSFTTTRKYFDNSSEEEKKTMEKMVNVGVRESIDSEEHPNVTPIIIAFDVTGSMGRIPFNMVKKTLPDIMDALVEANIPDPQVMFMAFGDHYSDKCPIQAGQFESDTEKIVNSLQSMYIERGGGGNEGESPTLAYLIAGYHTEIDSWHKRGKKGFLFTISDEPCHPYLEGFSQEEILGYEKGVDDKTAKEIVNKAKEQYHVFHIHVTDGSYSFRSVKDSWVELLGEDNVIACKSTDLLQAISNAIISNTSPNLQEEAPVEEAPVVYTY